MGVTTLTVNVFNITSRCPVCGGTADARYQASAPEATAQMKRKCRDCGFTWQQPSLARSF